MVTDIAGIAMERAEAERRIQFMAHHDPLTGLPNRSLFWSQFGDLLREAEAAATGGDRQQKLAVAYVDLDNFKQINDTLGHAAGDQVLKTLASRMRPVSARRIFSCALAATSLLWFWSRKGRPGWIAPANR